MPFVQCTIVLQMLYVNLMSAYHRANFYCGFTTTAKYRNLIMSCGILCIDFTYIFQKNFIIQLLFRPCEACLLSNYWWFCLLPSCGDRLCATSMRLHRLFISPRSRRRVAVIFVSYFPHHSERDSQSSIHYSSSHRRRRRWWIYYLLVCRYTFVFTLWIREERLETVNIMAMKNHIIPRKINHNLMQSLDYI